MTETDAAAVNAPPLVGAVPRSAASRGPGPRGAVPTGAVPTGAMPTGALTRRAVPTGPWGRPAQLPSGDGQEVVDLRTPHAPAPGAPFRPTPPPPVPPGRGDGRQALVVSEGLGRGRSEGRREREWRRAQEWGRGQGRVRALELCRGRWGRPGRRGWGRVRALELAVAVLLLAGLAALTHPHAPPPICPQAAWDARSAGAVDALAGDIATDFPAYPASPAAAAPPAASSSAVTRLRRDLAAARSAGVGVPPAPASAATWTRALAQVGAATAEWRSDPSRARSDLALAGLELTMVRSSASSPVDCVQK
jgi:hypothetical protein